MTSSNHYQIRIKGHLDERWMRWFEGFTVLQQLIDQAALFGALNRIHDLGLELVSVHQQVSDDEIES